MEHISSPDNPEHDYRTVYNMTSAEVEQELLQVFLDSDPHSRGWLGVSTICSALQRFGKERGIDHHALRLAFQHVGEEEEEEEAQLLRHANDANLERG